MHQPLPDDIRNRRRTFPFEVMIRYAYQRDRWKRRLMSFVIGSVSIHLVSFFIISSLLVAGAIGFIGKGLLIWPAICVGIAASLCISDRLDHGRGLLATFIVALLAMFVSYQFFVQYPEQMVGMEPMWNSR